MIFLAEFETDGPRYKREDTKKEMVPSKENKASKKKTKKQKNSTFTKLVNKTAGVTKFTQGEIAVVKSMAKNDIKTPLNNQKGKQKTIGAKKGTNYHRSM